MDEPFIPVFRVALLLICFGCMIGIYTALTSSGGTIETTYIDFVDVVFTRAVNAVNAVP